MPSEGPDLAAIRQCLKAVVSCVLAHAEKDAEFAADLAQTLMGDGRPEPRATKKPPELNLVEALKGRGEESLIQELGGLPTSELLNLAQHYEAAPPKQTKKMSRDELVARLVAKAHQRLGRGSEFIKSTSATDGDGQAVEQTLITRPADDTTPIGSNRPEETPSAEQAGAHVGKPE